MEIECAFGRQSFTVTLFDNASAHDLATMLPLDLSIEDYSTNEKIAYLPRKLTEDGSGPFAGEKPGDLCCYAPWGNLAFFHGSYRYSGGLIRLGSLNDGPKPLLQRGRFPLKIQVTN
ncbi:MFS transporter [Bradyrhizobium manausense]|nr:MFS transporter [Bradyrhizobium manausense]